MSFFSTRGENCVTASQAILQGIAPDGGLYVPAMFPPVSLSKISEMADMDYISRAVNVLKLFLEDFTIPEIEQAVKAAYGGDRFNDPAVAPLKKLDGSTWVMELFHGPTLAFKDMALQLLPHLIQSGAGRIPGCGGNQLHHVLSAGRCERRAAAADGDHRRQQHAGDRRPGQF